MPLGNVMLLAVSLTIKSAEVLFVVGVFRTRLDVPSCRVSRLSLGMREHPIREGLSLVAPRENVSKERHGRSALSVNHDEGHDFEGDDSKRI